MITQNSIDFRVTIPEIDFWVLLIENQFISGYQFPEINLFQGIVTRKSLRKNLIL